MGWRRAERKPVKSEFIQIREHQMDVLRELEEEGELEVATDEDGNLEGVRVFSGTEITLACQPGTYLVKEEGDLMPVRPDIFKTHFKVLD